MAILSPPNPFSTSLVCSAFKSTKERNRRTASYAVRACARLRSIFSFSIRAKIAGEFCKLKAGVNFDQQKLEADLGLDGPRHANIIGPVEA